MKALLAHKGNRRALVSLTILFTALGSLAWGLSEASVGTEIQWLLWVLGLGALLGLALAGSRCPGPWSALIIAIICCLGVLIYFGQLGTPLVGLGRGLLRLIGSLWTWLLSWLQSLRSAQEIIPPDATPLALSWVDIISRLGALLSRLWAWLYGLFTRRANYDPLAAEFTWALCLLLLAAWAAWHAFRRRDPLLGLAPAGALLAVVLNFTRSSPAPLALLVGALLLLMAVLSYDRHEHRWIVQHTDYAEDIEMESVLIATGLALGLMMLALAAPSISWQALVKFGREIFQPSSQSVEVAESFGLQPSYEGIAGAGGLPRQHMLGSAPDLLRAEVMTISTGELPPVQVIQMLPHPPARHYWRAITYDVYTGLGWETSRTVPNLYDAGEPALQDLPADIASQQFIHQDVTLYREAGSQLFYTGLLVTANQPYRVNWRIPAAEGADAFGAVLSARPDQALRYQVSSLRTAASVEALRAASGPLPQWISERYLQLPADLPERVRRLAAELTAPGPNGPLSAYDQASAIEAYLRTFPYSLDVPEPPNDRDVADYFLFDLKQGYCDYFATAMVVLARASGLPARLVIGYASGSYDPYKALYIITEADSHSWVEIYFPGIGWVEFEPTSSLAAIERPTRPEQTVSLPEATASGSWMDWLPRQDWDVTGWAAAGAILCFVVYNLGVEIDRWWLLHQAPAASIARLYRRLIRRTQHLTRSLPPGVTPFEYAACLQERLSGLDQAQARRLFAPAQSEIDGLTLLYTRAAYSAHRPTPADRRQAVHLWWRLRRRLLVANGLNKLRKIIKLKTS
ncbi:MAG TPA: transglutaminase domain-containing protein [Anaerolineales bacterium]|nr:transglutaminase domain-containing protein [Anaerolineales bacterium]